LINNVPVHGVQAAASVLKEKKKQTHLVELSEVLSSPLDNRNGSLNALSQNSSKEVGSYTRKLGT